MEVHFMRRQKIIPKVYNKKEEETPEYRKKVAELKKAKTIYEQGKEYYYLIDDTRLFWKTYPEWQQEQYDELYQKQINDGHPENHTEEAQKEFTQKYLEAMKAAAEKLYPDACEDLIRCYTSGAFGIEKNQNKINELIEKVCADGKYGWNQECFRFDEIIPFDNVQAINARLYKLMFEAYYRVSGLKEIFDGLISQGKKYYKDYEITARICYYAPDGERLVLPSGEEFGCAECEWSISTTYGKKMPSKMKALDLWNNYQFAFPEGMGYYFCRAMFEFVFPKIAKEGDSFPVWHALPDEVITKLNPKDFYVDVNVKIGHKTLTRAIKGEECEKLEKGCYVAYKDLENTKSPLIKRLKERYYEGPFILEDLRSLYLAKKLLKLELAEETLARKITKDFDEIKYHGCKVFKNLDSVTPSLIYNHHHLPRHFLGIKTKQEKANEFFISNMLGWRSSVEDFVRHDDRIFNWCECYAMSPFDKHYLCYSFHQLWDHCGLTRRQFLNIRPRNFYIGVDMDFEFEEEEKDSE